MACDFVYCFPGYVVGGLNGFKFLAGSYLSFLQLLNEPGLAVSFASHLVSLEKLFILFVGSLASFEMAVKVFQLQIKRLRLELKGVELIVIELKCALEKGKVGVRLQ